MVPSANALHQRPYVYYLAALGFAGFAVQIMSVSVGWQVYDLTHSALNLGFVGLAQFLPALALVLVTGLIADKFNRRLIIAVCLSLEVLCAFGLLIFTWSAFKDIWPMFVILAGFGTARAFMNPAADALAPNLLPKEALAHGISLGSMMWQITTITGPVAGGLLYGISGTFAYGVAVCLMLLAIICVALIGTVPQENHAAETNLSTQYNRWI